MVRWQDYQGPFSKVVGTFAGKLERKSIHPPPFKPGVFLCSFTVKRKFTLFVQDSIDPLTFLSSAFNAGVDYGENTDHSFGRTPVGYMEHFGAEMADQSSSAFFKEFAYPSIFSEDPRYYRLGHGSAKTRVFHAFGHVVLGHQQDGTYMFNISEWLGTTSAVAVADLYHPDNRPGVAPAAKNVGIAVLQDMGFDVLREFWPDLARKLKLPFRGENEPPD